MKRFQWVVLAGLLMVLILLMISHFAPRVDLERTVPVPSQRDGERPVLVVGDDHNYPPFSYLDDNGEATGFNIELMRAVASSMGYEVVFHLTEWNETRALLEAGEIDAISGMFWSAEREEIYDFTGRHTVTYGDIFTRPGLQISDLQELSDQRVAVQQGDIIGEYLEVNVPNVILVKTDNVEDALRMVETGEVLYAGVLKMPALVAISEGRISRVRAQNLQIMPQEYCIAVQKGNEDLLFRLNGGLQIVKATGDYRVLYERWLGVHEIGPVLSFVRNHQWLFIVAVALGGFLLILVGVLNHLVAKRTQALQSVNLRLAQQLEQSREDHERIAFLSYHDQLTSLYNRRWFEEELLRHEAGETMPFCMIMADVNGLKLVNDAFGHQLGDKLLVRTAEVMSENCRTDEMLCRIGGDEFVMLMPGMKESDAKNMVRRIRESMKGVQVASVDLSISFGWAMRKSAVESLDEVMSRAENAMYRNKLFESPAMRSRTMESVMQTLYLRNVTEKLHSQHVSCYCRRMAGWMDLPADRVEELETAGLMHDIGKVAIDENLLNRSSCLTEEEQRIITRHPEIGYRILSAVPGLSDQAQVVLSHHESWDGTGYPAQLEGTQIPLYSRVIAIADTYDAIRIGYGGISPRTREEAFEELEAGAGSRYDPELVSLFVARMKEEHDVCEDEATGSPADCT